MDKNSHGLKLRVLAIASTLAITACTAEVDRDNAPADQFMAALASHCGKAFAGKVTVNEPASSVPDPFEGKPPVLHVRDCDGPAREIHMPLHVGEDHSRAWTFTRTRDGLRFRHHQWRADGTADAVTFFGGTTVTPGTAVRQIFPVDAESIKMFKNIGLPASLENNWTVELHPQQGFTYELSRPDGRVFRLEFDFSQPVAVPPASWGDIGKGA
ncbi:MAG: hypothetical protein ACREP4_15260 [Stenotrophomonas sp.]|uniref:hypothetical protein n=1 Tax=Stenotrophomonas sp. TaxID=69392 RepID=UPI003D6C8E2A